MKYIILVLVVICTSFTKSYSQIIETTNAVGNNFTIPSIILGEEREIQIYLPEGYQDSKEKCPVLYVLDSQRYFLNAVGYQQTLLFQNETPSFIVVGIKTDNHKRRQLFYSESAKFISYLKDELIPYIDNRYRTLNERVYFGWEMAGALGIQIFAEHPELFKGYLLSSSTYLSDERLKALEHLFDTNVNLPNKFYFTLGSVEGWSLESTSQLAKLFEDKAPKELKWKYDLLDNENHYSTPLITMNNGLKLVFGDYAPIRFYSIDEFNDFGGMKALKAHYVKRGERYEVSTDVHEDTKHYLLLQAVREDDFSMFSLFENEFKGYLESYNRDVMFQRFGQFYLKHRAFSNAIDLYKHALKKIPNSSLLYHELGDAYFVNGEKEKALKAYKSALSIDSSLKSIAEKVKNIEKG